MLNKKSTMGQSDRKESVFELIRSMSKSEKRNFKLYATRQGDARDSKFITLFDCMDCMESYDEEKIIQRCPSMKREQLPNMKAHLYKQILISLRLLNVHHSSLLELQEQLDFARILFDKGLYNQAGKLLDKAGRSAEELEQYAMLLQVTDLRRQIHECKVSGEMTHLATTANRMITETCDKLETANELSILAVRLYSLHLRLGYARSQKDLDLLNSYFKPRLDAYAGRKLSFMERFYFYQAMAWFHYIRHNFAYAYRYGRAWIDMFEEQPQMKEVMYDSYLHGYSRFLEGLYLMRKYSLFVKTISDFEQESRVTGSINENAVMISQQILFTARINKCILEGVFKEGLWMTRSVDGYLKRYAKYLSVYDRMMLDYKIASLHFGDGNYLKCMEYLSGIMAVKDPQVRRDLQCYARMLNLVASYEAGIDHNLDYQIKSVFLFIVKMRDMTDMKREIFAFFRKLNNMATLELKSEFRVLYERLKPYEMHPYERRTFYYLDLTSWLKSKITGRNFGEIVRERFAEIVESEKKPATVKQN